MRKVHIMNSLKIILSIIPLIVLPIRAYYDYYPCDNDACFLLLENTIDDLLTRIETDEENIAQILAQQQANTQAITNLLSRIGVDEGTITQIVTQQKANTQAITNLLSRIGVDEGTITQTVTQQKANTQAIINLLSRIGVDEENITGLLANQEENVFLVRLETALQSLIQSYWLQGHLNNPGLINVSAQFLPLIKNTDLETWIGANGDLWGYNESGTLFEITSDLVRIDF